MVNHENSDGGAERSPVEAETLRSQPNASIDESAKPASPWVKHEPWTSTSTPPSVYGDFSSVPDVEDYMSSAEPTVEDAPIVAGSPGAATRSASTPERSPQANLLSHVHELEESGEYDVRALAPLRHLLEQDWADPNVRSRLKAKIEAAESPSEVETTKVSTVGGTGQASRVGTPARPTKPAMAKVPLPPITATTAPSPSELLFDDEKVSAPLVARSPAPVPPAVPSAVAPTLAADKARFRPWIPVLGAVFVVAAWAVPTESLFASGPPTAIPVSFVLSSIPNAEVFQGQERLGETPMVVEESQLGEGVTLRREGYQDALFTPTAPLTREKVEKIQVALEAAPAALDWNGLPDESKLWWQGKPTPVEALPSALPGSYPVKVVPPGRPPISLTLVVPEPSGDAPTSLPVGQQVAQALALQPTLNLAYQAGKGKAPKWPVTVTVTDTSKANSFQQTAKLDGKSASQLVLPTPGTYLVKVPASSTHLGFSKSLTVKETGSSQTLEIALKPLPPKVAPAPVASSSGSTGYSPQPYYAPAPVYYNGGGSGGGGGGGRIAPPSF